MRTLSRIKYFSFNSDSKRLMAGEARASRAVKERIEAGKIKTQRKEAVVKVGSEEEREKNSQAER